jgi:sulfur relay (sulfurtransferase) DsrF/TusC family protein
MKVLNIVGTAYRATLEEQDDPVIWMIHAMNGAGAEQALLLRGNAVNYCVAGQGVEPLSFGARRQGQSPQLAEQIGSLANKRVEVLVSQDCLEERGIGRDELVAGLKTLRRAELPQVMSRFDQVWHW